MNNSSEGMNKNDEGKVGWDDPSKKSLALSCSGILLRSVAKDLLKVPSLVMELR